MGIVQNRSGNISSYGSHSRRRKAHTKSGVKFLISVDGEAQSAQISGPPRGIGALDLFMSFSIIFTGERDSLLIRRYG